MKLLAAFIVACAGMLVVIAWYTFTSLEFGPSETAVVPPVASRPAPAQRTSQPHSPGPVPEREGIPDERAEPVLTPAAAVAVTLPAPGLAPPTSQATVQWAADPSEQAHRRRLDAARTLLQSDPDHPRALRDELTALVALRRWDEAASTAARLVSVTPDDMDLQFELGALQIKARRWTEAVATWREYVTTRPDEPRGWFNLAVAHQAAGHLSEARSAWDRCLALAPGLEARARRGEVLLDLEEWAAAADDFTAVCAEPASTPDAALNLALALWKLGRADEARARLLMLLEAHPRHVPALNRLAEMAWAACVASAPGERKACDEVVEWCRRSLECDPGQAEIAALRDAALRPRE